MPANLENSAQDWKRSVFIPIPKKGNAKEGSNYCTIALISHPSKEMLKILQARLQQYMNCELPNVKTGFRKGRGTRDQIANIHWIAKKAKEFSSYRAIALISHSSKVMLKIIQARLQQCVNFQMFKLVLEKAEKP